MTVRATSMESNQLNLWSGVYSGQRLAIIRWMRAQPNRWASRRLLGRVTDIEPSAMARPLNDLIADGLVEEADTPSPCPITGRNVYKVRLRP